MSSRLYKWTVSLAESRHAAWVLAALAFCESSFFPLPPDIVLVPMAVARPDKALFYAGICTVASVTGGMLGYAIGAFLYGTIGAWLVSLYGYGDRIAQLQDFYRHWGWAFILIKGLTPIPYKLVTIVSGVLGYDFFLFVILSIVTRGARFFILAGLLSHFGDSIRATLERRFATFLVVMGVVVVVGFVIAVRMA